MDGYGTKAVGLATLPDNSMHVLANASPTPIICSFPLNEKVCNSISLQPQDGYRGFGGFGSDQGSDLDGSSLMAPSERLCVGERRQKDPKTAA